MRKLSVKYLIIILLSLYFFIPEYSSAKPLSDHTFLIAEGNIRNLNSNRLWNFLSENNDSGVEINLSDLEDDLNYIDARFTELLQKIEQLTQKDEFKIVPVFLHFDGDINRLDSLINSSEVSSKLFFLPQGETWPSLEYLIQSNRRIVLFVDGDFKNESRILHKRQNYVFRISTNEIMENEDSSETPLQLNQELFMIDDFDQLRISSTPFNRNLSTGYINFLLKNWTQYGKRPNFIFTGKKYDDFDLTVSQLNSFTWIKGTVKVSGKTLEKVYWKNQDISVTGGKFSFPYKGGEELMLSAFVPGYNLSPKQIIITGEMEVPEEYSIIATPIEISQNLTGKFEFENIVLNNIDPVKSFEGENFSFTQDIERGNVVKLPEDASVNLGNPENFGLRNSSFTVSCFVKFSEIREFGDNAILGNYEREYRRGMHLILRSGHPYFGLWANDYISEEKLETNIWYHLVWRYIIETGEQAIFLNGRNIGSSNGHPPFSGTADILLGSALSKGASLRGYVDDLYFWNRPLGNEEINRLSLNEDVQLKEPTKEAGNFSTKALLQILSGFLLFIAMAATIVLLLKKIRNKNSTPSIALPDSNTANQIRLFSGFKAINRDGENITNLFTPKVKELFLFVLIHTVKNENGARISDINEKLWSGIEPQKIANNRAVTLNKLRKILVDIEGIEIEIQNRYMVAKMESPFFSDYVEAFKLCETSGGMSRQQLEAFFLLVKKGSFLKGTTWPWLDDIRGFTGNQVIDNLLNLASAYKKEKKLEEIDSIAKRILDYDDLNEEAIFLQIWVLQRTNNSHLAKFNFKTFSSSYEENMGEPYSMNFDQFINYYSGKY